MPQIFDTEVQQTTGTVNVPQPRAVVNNSTSDLINQIGSVGLQTAQDVQQGIVAGNKMIGQANLANYSIQLGKYQQAVEQGTMSSAAARTRIRDLRNQVIANNPSLLPQIDSTTSNFLSDSGLGADIVKGTQAEQQRADIVKQMSQEGWSITPDMPQDQQQELINAWQQQKLAQQQVQQAQAQIALTRGQLGIQSDRLGLEKDRQSLATGAITQQTDALNLQIKLHQTAANQAVFSGAQGWTTNFASSMNNIVQQFQSSAKSPADVQKYTDQVNLELAKITAAANQAGLGGDQSVVSQAIAPMKALADATTQFLQGKIQTQALQDQTTNAKNSAVLLAIHAADEKGRKVLGIAMAAPGMSSSLQTSLVDGVVLHMLGTNSQDPGTPGASAGGADIVVGRGSPNFGSVNAYLDGIKAAVAKSNLGTLDPNSEKLLANNITNIANGILGTNTKAKSPQDYNQIMQFLADPAINAYIVKHPDIMRTGDMKGVSDMLAHEYTLNVMPLVKQEWQQATSPQGKGYLDFSNPTSTPYGSVPTYSQREVPRNTVAHPEFTGGGIRFVADNNDPQTIASVEQLNQKVAPVMARLIRATATMEGTSNYRKVWNENYASWFGAKPTPAPPGENDNPQPAAKIQEPASAPTTMTTPTKELMDALIHQESRGNNDAVSSAGAISQVQMLPSTAAALGYTPDDLKDPATARQAGKEYLGMMLDQFGGNVKLALAAYNAGPGTVRKLVKKYGNDYAAIESHLPKETQDYVPSIIGRMNGG